MNTMRKILVVDDDPVIGKSFDRVLTRKGYAVINAANGEEALTKLATESYDAVFTDIRMPGMSGIEVAEQVRARRPWTPVVIITGFGTDDNEARAKAAGVSGFVRKPLSPAMIEDSLDAAIADAPALAAAMYATAEPAAVVAAEPAGSAVKNVAMLVGAPLAGLAFVALFPLIGLGMLGWLGARALATHGTPYLKNAALFFAAPFITLAYVGLFPFIGLGMLGAVAMKALRQKATA